MTELEILEKIHAHFEKWDWEQCSGGYGGCVYHRCDGHRCAVGALLTEEEACGMSGDLLSCGCASLPNRLQDHFNLLVDLQMAHDGATSASAFRDFVETEIAERRGEMK